MTVSAHAKPLGGRLPSADEKAAANQLRKIIASNAGGDATLRMAVDEKRPVEVTLTPGLSNLLIELLRHVGRGDAVTLVPVTQMLTTQQAADILNVSRPFLIGLLESKKIEFELVGRHRRIRAEDLFRYKSKRDQDRSDALSRLASIDAEVL